MNLWPFKRKSDRTWDFEGRCLKCGKSLKLMIYVSSRSLILLRLADLCEDHPQDGAVLWPAFRDDIIGVEYDEDKCSATPSASSSPSPSEYEKAEDDD